MAFLDPDPEMQILREDLAWPPALGSDGDLAGVAGLDCLEADLVARAATTPGEIIHRPTFGTELDQTQGGPTFDEDLGAIQARLLEQYTRDPRVQTLSIEVVRDDVDGGVVAHLSVTPKTGATFGLAVPIGS